jgi:hypothetical protein
VIDIPVVVTLLDHDSIVTIPVVTLANNFTIAIPIPIVTGSDGYADRTDTDSNFFRTGRHRKGYSGNSNRSHYKTLDHCHAPLRCELPTANAPMRQWFLPEISTVSKFPRRRVD